MEGAGCRVQGAWSRAQGAGRRAQGQPIWRIAAGAKGYLVGSVLHARRDHGNEEAHRRNDHKYHDVEGCEPRVPLGREKKG